MSGGKDDAGQQIEAELTDAPAEEIEAEITDAPIEEVEPEITDAPVEEVEPEITDVPIEEIEPEITDVPIEEAEPEPTATAGPVDVALGDIEIDEEAGQGSLWLSDYDAQTMSVWASMDGEPMDAWVEGGSLWFELPDDGRWNATSVIEAGVQGDTVAGGQATWSGTLHWEYDDAGALVAAVGEAPAPEDIVIENGFIVDSMVSGDGEVTVTGTAQPFAAISVSLRPVGAEATELDVVNAAGNGGWEWQLPLGLLEDGETYSLGFSYVDAPNGVYNSDPFSYAAPIGSLSADMTRITDDGVRGTTKADVNVALYLNELDRDAGTALAQTVSGPEGDFTLTLEGGHTFEELGIRADSVLLLRAWDDAGNVTDGSVTVYDKNRIQLQLLVPSGLAADGSTVWAPRADRLRACFVCEPGEDVSCYAVGEDGEQPLDILDTDNQGQVWVELDMSGRSSVELYAVYDANGEQSKRYTVALDDATPLVGLDDGQLTEDGLIDPRLDALSGAAALSNSWVELVWTNSEGELSTRATTDGSGRFSLSNLSLAPETEVVFSVYGQDGLLVGSQYYGVSEEEFAPLTISHAANATLESGALLSDGTGGIQLQITGQPDQYVYLSLNDLDGQLLQLDGQGELSCSIVVQAGENHIAAWYQDDRESNQTKGAEDWFTVEDTGAWRVAVDQSADVTPGVQALTGTAVPGATVILERDGEELARAEADGETGRFELPALAYEANADYAVRGEYMGQNFSGGTFHVRALDELDIELDRFADGSVLVDVDGYACLNLMGEPDRRVVGTLDGGAFSFETTLNGDGFTDGEISLPVTAGESHALTVYYTDDADNAQSVEFTPNGAYGEIRLGTVYMGSQALSGDTGAALLVYAYEDGEPFAQGVQAAADGRFELPEHYYRLGADYSLEAYCDGHCVGTLSFAAQEWAEVTISGDGGVINGSRRSYAVGGMAQAGQRLVVSVGDAAFETTADEDGGWSFEIDLGSVTLPVNEPYPIIVSYAEDPSVAAGIEVVYDPACQLSLNDAYQNSPALTGYTDADAVVSLYLNGQGDPVARAQASGQGTFSLDLSGIDIEASYAVSAVDPNGNVSQLLPLNLLEVIREPIIVAQSDEGRVLHQGDDRLELVIRAEANQPLTVWLSNDVTGGQIDVWTLDANDAGVYEIGYAIPEDAIPAEETALSVIVAYSDGFGEVSGLRIPVDLIGPVLSVDAVSEGGKFVQGKVSGAVRVTLSGTATAYEDRYDHEGGTDEDYMFRITDETLTEGQQLEIMAVDAAGNVTRQSVAVEANAEEEAEVQVSADEVSIVLHTDDGRDTYSVNDTVTVSGTVSGVEDAAIKSFRVVDADDPNGAALYKIARRGDLRGYVSGNQINGLPFSVNSAMAGKRLKLVFELNRIGDVTSGLTLSVEGKESVTPYIGERFAMSFDERQNNVFAPGSIILLSGWYYGETQDANYQLTQVEPLQNGYSTKNIKLAKDAGLASGSGSGWCNALRSSVLIREAEEGRMRLPADIEATDNNAGFVIYFDPASLGLEMVDGETYTLYLSVESKKDEETPGMSIDIRIEDGGQMITDAQQAYSNITNAWIAAMPTPTPEPTVEPTATPAP